MHLFLYQAARHKAPVNYYSASNRSRYVQGTIRGDFDLELLKRGIKGRYQILPHGEHEFQKMLKQVDLEEEFYGHVVQITEAKNAIWFKLNYDQVGKGSTKYIGGWRDLSPDDLSSVVTEYQNYSAQLRIIVDHLSQMRYQANNLLRFATGMRNKPVPCVDGLGSLAEGLSSTLNEAQMKVLEEENYLKNKKAACQQTIRDYLNQRKF